MTSTAFAPDASVPDWRPTLEGATIVLRPIRPDDFDALHAVASDPAIWVQHPNSDRYRREVFEGFFASGLASNGAFAVIERATGRMIGSSRFYDWCAPSASIVIGYTFLARDRRACRRRAPGLPESRSGSGESQVRGSKPVQPSRRSAALN